MLNMVLGKGNVGATDHRGISWISRVFSALSTVGAGNSPLHVRKIGLIRENTSCGSTSPMGTDWRNQLQNVFWQPYDNFLEVWTDCALHAHQSCNSFCGPLWMCFETLVSWASHSRDFLDAVPSFATSIIQFPGCQHSLLPVWLFVSDAAVVSLSANLYILCIVGSAYEIFWGIFHQTCSCIEHVHCSALYDSTHAVTPPNGRLANCMK